MTRRRRGYTAQDPGARKDDGPDDPLFQGRLHLSWSGGRLGLAAPHSVFSSQRIDDGTLLLLENLGAGSPRNFLDLGCGYGALGLSVAARFPEARGLLVDRDLLAVNYARLNAAAEGIGNVEVLPGLGYDRIPPKLLPFDRILANIPARAGDRVFEHFIGGGLRRLAPGGDLRLVVIAPLAEAVAGAAARIGLAAEQVAATARHAVFAIHAGPGGTAGLPAAEPGEELYLRDTIDLELPERLRLDRPTDLADEPHRLGTAIPLLAENLPSEAPERILVFRPGYGLVAALALARWPRASVTAVDRDLLAAAYTRRNCAAAADRIRVIETLGIGGAAEGRPYDLVLGELSAPVGPRAMVREIEEAGAVLASGGRALIIGFHRHWKEFLRERGRHLGLRLLAARGPMALLELRGPAACAAPGVRT